MTTRSGLKNGHYYGIGVKYRQTLIKSSSISEATQNKNSLSWEPSIRRVKLALLAPEEIIKNHSAKYGINYGLEWDLGAITPMFGYQYVWQDGGNKDHQFGLSAKAPVAGGTVKVRAIVTHSVRMTVRQG